MNIADRIGIHGHMEFSTWEQDGTLAARVENDNIMCVAGLNVLIQAINWAGMQDQNTAMGSPFSSTILTPVYGAVGTGVATPADTDVTLVTEVARSSIIGAGLTNASAGVDAYVSWSFLFGLPGSNYSIIEAGVFVNALATANNGTMLDHATLGAVSWTTTQLATLVVTFSFGNS